MLLSIEGDEATGTRHKQLVRQIRRRWDDLCWSWPAHNGQGYAVLRHKGKVVKACIVAYELRYGPVPVGKELDHTCMNKGCWNPWHMEPVTRSENVLRGDNPGGNAIKIHCPKGHPYSHYQSDGRRACIICRRENQRRRRKEAKENVAVY